VALTEECQGRLLNWKFGQALRQLTPDATEGERELVTALTEVFGDVGWFDGSMATIVAAALAPHVPSEG
jgi:hypothetical protein